jgi:hypothetical protein
MAKGRKAITNNVKQLRGTARKDREPQQKVDDFVKPLDHVPAPPR